MLVGSITGFIEQHGQWALLLMFVLLALESFGLPLPGETALIACGVLASQGALSIGWVIAVAAIAAILDCDIARPVWLSSSPVPESGIAPRSATRGRCPMG